MSTDQPIACSLSQSELSTRLAAMAQLGAAALIEVRRRAVRAELVFAADAAVRERLEAIVAAEAQCCPSLTMSVTERGTAITLAVEAPEGAEVALSEIIDAFGDPSRRVA